MRGAARGGGVDGVRAGQEGLRGAVGGDDDEGKKGAGQEGGDGEDQEAEGCDAGAAFPGGVDFGGGEIRVRGEVGVDVELADVGRDVGEKGEPADPVEELGFAYFADLRIEALYREEDLLKEGDDS